MQLYELVIFSMLSDCCLFGKV